MRIYLFVLFLALAAFAQDVPAYYNVQQDSIAVEYARQAERYTESGDRLSKAGTGFFIGGGALIALATAEVIHYTIKKKDTEDYDEVEKENGAVGLVVLAGAGCILGGAFFKISSNKKKSRAEHYKEQLKDYQKAHHSVSLKIWPTFEPIGQAYGGNLLLDF